MSTTFGATGGTTHSSTITGLSSGNAYTYYVRCIDTSSNANTNDYTISFNVDSVVGDTTPPARSLASPSGNLSFTTIMTTLSLSTDEDATCRYDTSPNTIYASMVHTFTNTGTTTHTTTISGLTSGQSYDYYVRCSDSSNNANGTDYTISFSIDDAPVAVVPPSTTSTTSGSIPVSTGPVAGCTNTTAFSPLSGRRCPISVAQPGGVSNILSISRNLSWKMKGEDVRILQQYLNTHGYPIAPTGVGSLGHETTYFGLATKAALIKFQIAHKILPATGTYGPKSKVYVRTTQ
jgi:hypothetical protein